MKSLSRAVVASILFVSSAGSMAAVKPSPELQRPGLFSETLQSVRDNSVTLSLPDLSRQALHPTAPRIPGGENPAALAKAKAAIPWGSLTATETVFSFRKSAANKSVLF